MQSVSMARAPTTAELGELYRRRTLAEALAHLGELERTVMELRHRHAATVEEIVHRLHIAPERSVESLIVGHRQLVRALPWLAGDLPCCDARAALLAGTDRAADIDHVRRCSACGRVDLLAAQAALAQVAAWDGSWLADEVQWATATCRAPLWPPAPWW